MRKSELETVEEHFAQPLNRNFVFANAVFTVDSSCERNSEVELDVNSQQTLTLVLKRRPSAKKTLSIYD